MHGKFSPPTAAETKKQQVQRAAIMGQLAGGVLHDFNNILTVITGTIEILAEAVADRADLAAIANLIDEAATRGAQLTSQLLTFVRGQSWRTICRRPWPIPVSSRPRSSVWRSSHATKCRTGARWAFERGLFEPGRHPRPMRPPVGTSSRSRCTPAPTTLLATIRTASSLRPTRKISSADRAVASSSIAAPTARRSSFFCRRHDRNHDRNNGPRRALNRRASAMPRAVVLERERPLRRRSPHDG